MTGRSPATETERTTYRMPANPNAVRFVQALETYRSPEQRDKYRRYFKLDEGQYGEGDVFIGVRMGQVFALAKEFIDMPPEDIEKLLESPIHEVRAGATSIMDKQGRSKKTTESRRKALWTLPAARGQDQQLGPCRPCRSLRGRTLPVRQTARCPVQAGALRKPVGAPDRHRRHLLLHQAGRRGRHSRSPRSCWAMTRT